MSRNANDSGSCARGFFVGFFFGTTEDTERTEGFCCFRIQGFPISRVCTIHPTGVAHRPNPRCSLLPFSLDHFPASGDVFVAGVTGAGSWRHHRCAFYPGIRALEDRFREMIMSLAKRPRERVIPWEQESHD